MHPLLRVPYAMLAAVADTAAAIAPAAPPDAPKWRRALSARRDLPGRYRRFAAMRDAHHPLAWFHAPSAGEALMALPVMDAVGAACPAAQRAFTWFSPSTEPFVHRFTAEFRDYLPFDSARGARLALDSLRPTLLTYSKLDVWPVLTAYAARRRAGPDRRNGLGGIGTPRARSAGNPWRRVRRTGRGRCRFRRRRRAAGAAWGAAGPGDRDRRHAL